MWDAKPNIKSVPIEFLFSSGMFQIENRTLLALLDSYGGISYHL